MSKKALAALVVLVYVFNLVAGFVPVNATTLFTEGFETNFNAWIDYGEISGVTGVLKTTVWKQAGTYSLATDGNNYDITHKFSPALTSHISTLDFYMKLGAGDVNHNPQVYLLNGDIDLGNDAYLYSISIAYNGSLAVDIANGMGGAFANYDTMYTAGAVNSLDVLHLQAYLKIAASTSSNDGEFRLFLNGVEVITDTGLDNFNDIAGRDPHVSYVELANYWAEDYQDFYIDSIVLTDSAPSAPPKDLTVNTATWREGMPHGVGTTNVTGTHTYTHGAAVTISATAGTNSHFKNWVLTGASPGNYTANPITVSLTATSTLTAVFDWGGVDFGTNTFDTWPGNFTNVGATRHNLGHYVSAPWSISCADGDYFYYTVNQTRFNGDYRLSLYLAPWLHSPAPNPWPVFTVLDDDYQIQTQVVLKEIYYRPQDNPSYATLSLGSATWSPITTTPLNGDGSIKYQAGGTFVIDPAVNVTNGWQRLDFYYYASTGKLGIYRNYVSCGNFTVNNPLITPDYIYFGDFYNYYNNYDGFGGIVDYDDMSLGYQAEYVAPPIVLTVTDVGLYGDSGNWVFVGPKNYVFYLDYTGNATAYQIGFTTADNRAYSWLYDSITGQVTNTAPNEGVSGAYVSTNGTRALFNLKFNLPVADTLNATLWGRVYSDDYDTGQNPGDLFNIYNVGGYAVVDADGWAGRIYDTETGKVTGDVFEIYAADSRTAFMIDDQPFGTTGSFLPFQYKADPRKELPNWEFVLTDDTHGFIELKADHIAPGVPPYPFNVGVVDGGPSSMHVFSDGVNDYTPRASVEFRRQITDETVNATYWVLFHGNLTYAKIRLAQNNLYNVGGFEASTFEVKNTTFCYRVNGGGLVRLYNATPDTWYRISQIVNVTAQTQIINVCNVNLGLLDSTGEIPVYQTVTYLDHWVVIAQDSGDPSASCDLYVDELKINSDYDADYGGVVKASMIYHRLQQWRQDFDFSIEEGSKYTAKEYANYGFIELGLDYMVNDVWVNNGLWCRINVTDSDIQNRNNWVKYTVSWYRGNELLRNDTLYGLFYGYSGADIGDSRKDASGLHWATWFNRANASTVVGGRVNMEYYGMSDKAAWWSLFSSDWKPMLSDVDESTCYMRILDANGDPCTVKDVSLVRAWERVYRTNSSTFHYSIQNIREQNFQTAGSTMEGIDTPPITRTATPTMPGGFLGSALAAIMSNLFRRLGDGLLWGGLMVWSQFAGFIDVIAAYFGAQGWYQYVLTQITLGMNAVTTASGYLLTINVWIWNGLTWGFGWFGSIIYVVTLWSQMLGNAWGMLTGTYVGTIDLVSTFQLGTFALILVICLPLIIVDRMASRGIFRTWDEIRTVLSAFGWVMDYLGILIDGFVNLVFRLIEAIPVIE